VRIDMKKLFPFKSDGADLPSGYRKRKICKGSPVCANMDKPPP
jgi:hypothetical protein